MLRRNAVPWLRAKALTLPREAPPKVTRARASQVRPIAQVKISPYKIEQEGKALSLASSYLMGMKLLTLLPESISLLLHILCNGLARVASRLVGEFSSFALKLVE